MSVINYRPIGVIKTPFKEPKGTPIQPTGAKGIQGTIILKPEYTDGLKDLEGFSHLIILYHFHLTQGYSLHVQPYLDIEQHGVFATRIPGRPNPIGLSIVQLMGINKNILYIQDVDIVCGTPLLDIKPYVPAFDLRDSTTIGWLSERVKNVEVTKSNGRLK